LVGRALCGKNCSDGSTCGSASSPPSAQPSSRRPAAPAGVQQAQQRRRRGERREAGEPRHGEGAGEGGDVPRAQARGGGRGVRGPQHAGQPDEGAQPHPEERVGRHRTGQLEQQRAEPRAERRHADRAQQAEGEQAAEREVDPCDVDERARRLRRQQRQPVRRVAQPDQAVRVQRRAEARVRVPRRQPPGAQFALRQFEFGQEPDRRLGDVGVGAVGSGRRLRAGQRCCERGVLRERERHEVARARHARPQPQQRRQQQRQCGDPRGPRVRRRRDRAGGGHARLLPLPTSHSASA
jgi:hypothetical protein